MIKAIIFDFDGVLAESVGIKTAAFARLFKAEGEDAVRRIVEYHSANAGVSRFEKFKYIYKNILRRELSEKMFNDLCDNFSSLVMNAVIAAPYVNGAEDFLKKYYLSYDCFLASATPHEEIVNIVRKREMTGFFSGIFGSPKTKSEIAREIMSTYGYKNTEMVFVGDAVSDYEAARLNDIRFIARVNSNEVELRDKECLKVPDLTNLIDYLKIP